MNPGPATSAGVSDAWSGYQPVRYVSEAVVTMTAEAGVAESDASADSTNKPHHPGRRSGINGPADAFIVGAPRGATSIAPQGMVAGYAAASPATQRMKIVARLRWRRRC